MTTFFSRGLWFYNQLICGIFKVEIWQVMPYGSENEDRVKKNGHEFTPMGTNIKNSLKNDEIQIIITREYWG